MIEKPFYDPTKSYDDNYQQGPFGSFADGVIYEQSGEPQYSYGSAPVYLPFGIPAGPLVNSNFCKAAFEKGFDVCVYKTVRSAVFPCHPFPNVLAVHPKGDLTPGKAQTALIADLDYREPLSITNSFGVPSKDPFTWQEDVAKAISYAGKGQLLVLSFMGTVRSGQTQEEFINDYVLAARLAHETGAKALEVNLSCPNIGNEGLVCYNIDVTRRIAQGIRKVIGNTFLALKVGYYKDDDQLGKMARIAHEYANEIAAINTLQTEIRDKDGNQALPGPLRLRSGVCGDAIRWAGLEMVHRLKQIKDERNLSYSICGVGGVVKPEDYDEYIKAGADAVMSATGAMWNPHLAIQIREKQ